MLKNKTQPDDYRRMSRTELSDRLSALQADNISSDSESARDVELKAVLHELEVSQIELEVQNQELIESRQAVDESHDRYMNLYDFAPVGYMTLDKKGFVRELNLTAADLFGIERQRLLNHSLAPRILKEDLQKFREHLVSCRDSEAKVTTDINLLGKDQTIIPVQLLSASARDQATGEMLFRTAITDLTEKELARKRLEAEKERELHNQEALKKAKAEAERANQSKSAFLANMSHEIRTPLGAILGFTELIRDSSSREERTEFAKIINRNGKALTRLIDDILDLSKVEAGRLELEHIDFNLRDLTEEIIGIFQEAAKQKNIGIHFEFAPETPEKVNSDPTRIRQILVNLLGNAVKFTSRGRVEVFVKFQADGSGQEQIEFQVKDTGIGLTKEQSLKLFEPFCQADNSTTRKFGGTGLGLVLSRRLARVLGGDVIIREFTPDKGCTFVAYVNASKIEINKNHVIENREHPNARTSEFLHGAKILLVEDSPDNQLLVKRLLSNAGMRVDVADNGAEGIEMAGANDYDVILMDMQMPILDGYEATEKLRHSGYSKPIVALTAHAMVEDRKRILALGCDAHLTKPLDSKLLIETINRLQTWH